MHFVEYHPNLKDYCKGNITMFDYKRMAGDSAREIIQVAPMMNKYLEEKNFNFTIQPAYDETIGKNLWLTLHTPSMSRAETITVEYSKTSEKPFLRTIFESMQKFAEGGSTTMEKIKTKTLKNLKKIGYIK